MVQLSQLLKPESNYATALVPEGEEVKSKRFQHSSVTGGCVCAHVCANLSSTHRFAFTTSCCIQHFLLNMQLGLSPAHQCEVPDQTCLFSCTTIRKTESVLRNKSGNSSMLIVSSPSFIPQKSPHKLNPSTTTLAGDKSVLWGSGKGGEEIISASKATGQVVLQRWPRRAQALRGCCAQPRH